MSAAARRPVRKTSSSDGWLTALLTQQEPKRGTLIAFEGPNGSGKTTQRKLFKTWLESEGRHVVATKWASSPLVKPLIKVRQAVHAMSPEENSLLHAADFRQLLETEVLPGALAGKARPRRPATSLRRSRAIRPAGWT